VTAMVGWGHLYLPFLFGRKRKCVPVLPRTSGEANQATDASSIGGERRSRSTGEPESQESGKEYTVADKLSSIIINGWLTVRTAGSQKSSLVTIGPIASRKTGLGI
jgi:hypothetical protein